MKAYVKGFLSVQEPSSYVIPGGSYKSGKLILHADKWRLTLPTLVDIEHAIPGVLCVGPDE